MGELLSAARVFQRLGEECSASAYIEQALQRSLERSGDQFLWVLSQLLEARPADDPLLLALPKVFMDVERWCV